MKKGSWADEGSGKSGGSDVGQRRKLIARGTQQTGAMRDVLVASKPLALLSQIRQPGDGQFHNDEIGIVVYFGPQQQGLGAISCHLFVSDIPRGPVSLADLSL